MTEADLPAAADLLARVGLSGASTMLRRYLRWQPDGVWKLEPLAACGFTEARPLRRMRLGPPVAARPDWLWTLASPGAG